MFTLLFKAIVLLYDTVKLGDKSLRSLTNSPSSGEKYIKSM